jgi:predicted alpha/beta superfamily hydrolase
MSADGGAGGAASLSPTAVNVTFRVALPASTPPGDTVFIAGDFQGWNPGSLAHVLSEQPDGRWTITLAFNPGQSIQFKFTRGSWAKVEKGPNGEEIPNRQLTVPAGGGALDFTVASWADIGTITGHVESFTYAPFLAGRRIWVYLPPDYATSSARYPVLYMHDGQNLFDVRTSFAGEWRVDEACEGLIGTGQIAPLIVVGIENGGASRLFEYTPWPASGYGGGGGDTYLTAVRDVLKPEVDRRYRTLTGRNHTWMCGSSLGGLISAYAGYAYQETYSRIAAVSPSYWWDGDHMMSYAASRGRPNLLRIYQDMGTIEEGSTVDQDGNGTDDYIDDLRAMRDVLVAQGFVVNLDLVSLEAQGHQHNEFYWAQRVPDMLRFLVGAAPTLGVPRLTGVGRAVQAAPHRRVRGTVSR